MIVKLEEATQSNAVTGSSAVRSKNSNLNDFSATMAKNMIAFGLGMSLGTGIRTYLIEDNDRMRQYGRRELLL